MAYLTDTAGLPADTTAFVQQQSLDVLVLDCSLPPQPQTPRNHNDLNLALQIIKQLQPGQGVLNHVGHTLDAWLIEHADALPGHVIVAQDGMVL